MTGPEHARPISGLFRSVALSCRPPGRLTHVDHPTISLPASRSQLSRMGKRLAAGRETVADRELYEQTLDAYDQAQIFVTNALQGATWPDLLGELAVSGRTKSIDTLIQKLQRTPGLQLPYIHDIAGVRVVGGLTLRLQRTFAESLAAAFGVPNDRIIDRIAVPQSGYRALHVVVEVSGIPVEIQVRTRLQSLWADIYERLADSWGRQIRYGDPPDENPEEPWRAEMVAKLIDLSTGAIADIEEMEGKSWDLQRVLADEDRLAAAMERLEPGFLGLPVPATEEDVAALITELRSRVQEARQALEEDLLRLGAAVQDEAFPDGSGA
jgi:ppGpp synthetase/RelA/SpoT-type nucleotidyltranferase